MNTVSESLPVVVGTLGSGLRIERISSEARILFDRPVDMLIGESLLEVVAEDDVPTCLNAFAEAAATQRGVTVTLSTIPTERRPGPLLCEVLITPLRPSPGYAIVLRPVPTPALDLRDSGALTVIPNRSHRAAQAGGSAPGGSAPGGLRGVSDCGVPGVGRLTTREMQIVSRLLNGHRPPGIARDLFLSQSTVRNHLASVFKKLGVASQEALLELFRGAQPTAGAQRPPFIDRDSDRDWDTDRDRVTWIS